MLHRRVVVTLAALAMLPLACTDDDAAPTSTTLVPSTTTTEPVRTDDGVLTIGLLLPRSGEGATIGQGMIEAAEQAVRELNAAGGVLDHRVQVVQADEGSDASSASDGVDTLLAEAVDAVVGPASSTVALSTLGSLLSAGVLTCSPTATSLALDNYPSSELFFRTAPSDSLQAQAIAELATRTGRVDVAVAFLDDAYGHPLAEATVDALRARGLAVEAQVPFASNDESLDDEAIELSDSEAGVVVVIGDGEHGVQMLSAMGEIAGRFPESEPPNIIVNDAVRRPPSAQLVQDLPEEIRERIEGVSPLAEPLPEGEEPAGPFATNAYDCVNLIALAAVQAESDNPRQIYPQMSLVSSSGQPCRDFELCAELLRDERNIDYEGPASFVQIGSDGDPERTRFDVFKFDESGVDVSTFPPLFIP